ncbi:MAG: TIGR02444 family protein [Halioglobus sp.]
MNNDFWTFSLACYGQDGVAQSCLLLQDGRGLDVNVILYAAWLASMNKVLSGAHLAGLEAAVAPWQQRVVAPLRAQRRALQGYSEAAKIRQSLQALELEAERKQQDIMWSFFLGSDDIVDSPDPLKNNLALLWGSDHSQCAEFASLLQKLRDSQAHGWC